MAGLKRTGFKRAEYAPPAPAPVRPIENGYRDPAMGTYATAPWANGGRPKEPRIEIPHLMVMARRPQQICLLRVPGVCPGAMLRDDCCHAHMNGAEFNKGLGMKAHDFFGCRACSRCHTWLDSSYSATGEERQAQGKIGLDRQIAEWRYLFCTMPPGKDRVAIGEALSHLRERRYMA